VRLSDETPSSESNPEIKSSGREASGRETAGRVAESGTFLADHRAAPPESGRRPLSGSQRRVLAFTWIGVFLMMVYGIFMVLSFFNPGYRPIDYIAMLMLLFGILFIMLHGLGYANSVIKAAWGYDEVRRRAFTPQRTPKIACLVASFNEPPDVLDETIAAVVGMDYPNKQVVLLDDSTNEESRRSARAIAERYGVEVVQRTNRRGYKAGAINDFLPETDATYVAVFDADALPAHNFLRDLVPIIEENPRLAFVQTPQYYSNTEISNVALASARQQAVFYEYICEGKSHSHAIFCCGTNVVFRRQALLDVKGFAEDSVTEDFATSLNMHLKGYDSAYYNQVYVYSLAPETLSAYFTQQSRWALGSVGMLRHVLAALFRGAGRMRFGQWWEYFLSSTYYMVGWVNFFFMCLPLLYIFFGIKPLRQDVFTYLAIFIPYMIFTMNMFYMGMEARGYRIGDMIMGQQIGFLCFPIHMVSSLSGLLGLKRPFATTPKGHGGKISLLALWPQLLMLLLSAVAFLWGVYRYTSGLQRNDSAILINALWALYHVFLLSGLFVLNRSPLRRSEYQRHFEESDVRGSKARVVPTAELAAATAGGAAGVGPGLFAPVGASGERSASTPTSRIMAPARPRSGAGGWALGLTIVSLLVVGAVGWSMIAWTLAPSQPVNVYVVDRTVGRDYQEHRGLIWTLNYLKLRKQNDFGPQGDSNHGTGYDFAKDFWGYIPGDTSNKQVDETHQADYKVFGENRPLPAEFKAPGVVYLADTYGEFVEYDFGLEKYVRYVSEPRGILPDEVDRIEDFHDRGGLVIGEWNTIGYPTLPADSVTDRAALQQGLAQVAKGLAFYRTQELPSREAKLKAAQARGDQSAIATFEQQVAETKTRIAQSERDAAEMRSLIETAAQREAQLAAQRRLEKLLKSDYRGWYGRYVDDFAEQREYDFRLWKNVQDALRKRFPNDKSKWEPQGPGFVFYKDGPSRIYDPETKKMEENPFSEPIVVTSDELGEGPTNKYAEIYKNSKAASDPLLKNVPENMACRFWFDVVKPLPGAKVLAYYKLQLKDAAAQRLMAAGFPAEFFQKRENDRTEVVMPAAIASRDGNSALRSLYFCGDASDYQLVSRFAQMFPSTGGVLGFMGRHTGSFSTQFYWNFYEPILKSALTDNKKIQHTS
jgi:cellulose synthase (UDP-forming)